MKNFDRLASLQIDQTVYRLERSHGLARLYWRIVLAWREYRAMGG